MTGSITGEQSLNSHGDNLLNTLEDKGNEYALMREYEGQYIPLKDSEGYIGF